MKGINISYLGQTRWWWVVLVVGILLVVGGFAYWFWPVAGYAVASILFGWLLILAGIVQLCVAAGPNHPKGWGWWIAGGVIDMFIGFMLVRNVILAEAVVPYFLAFIFIFWGSRLSSRQPTAAMPDTPGWASSTASSSAFWASFSSKPVG